MKTIDLNQSKNQPDSSIFVNSFSQKYQIHKTVIGNGTYSIVHLGIETQTNLLVATKIVKYNIFNFKETIRLIRQITLLKQLKHPNIIQLKDVYLKTQRLKEKSACLVLQYFPFNLKKVIHSKIYLNQLQIKKIFFQIICGLAYCQEQNVLHRDLKPQNILISEDLQSVKICDFGLARSVTKLQSKLSNIQQQNSTNQLDLTSYVVSRWYRAPEIILLATNYSHKIDLWAAGCILAELTNMLPQNSPHFQRGAIFPGKGCFPLSPPKSKKVQYEKMNGFPHSSSDQLNRIFQILGTPQDLSFLQNSSEMIKKYVKSFKKRSKIPFKFLFEKIDQKACDLLQKLLKINPQQRISAKQAINHQYFNEIRSKYAQNVEKINSSDKPIKIQDEIRDSEDIITFFSQFPFTNEFK